MPNLFEVISQSQYASEAVLAVMGVIIGHIASSYSNKMAALKYTVVTSKLGQTSENDLHGSIEIRHMGQPLHNFYFSNVSLRNCSNSDLENVKICFFVCDGVSILTDFMFYKNAVASIPYSPEYAAVSTDVNHPLRLTRREFVIPVFNRGQEIGLELTITHKPTVEAPLVHATAVHKGARLTEAPNGIAFHGVPASRTLPWAVVIGLMLYGSICWIFQLPSWATAFTCLMYGFFAQTVSAYFIKSVDWIRVKLGLLPPLG